MNYDTKKQCALVESYKKEMFDLERLNRYAHEQLVKKYPSELQVLRECILEREYAAIEITEETALN